MKLNNYIDHTNLNVKASDAEIIQLCKEAREHEFPAVCVSPNHVSIAKKALEGSSANVCTVIGFPNGYQTTATKIFEMKELIREGATELDVVLNLQNVKDGKWSLIQNELNELRKIAGSLVIKLIIEASILEEKEIQKICKIGCDEKIDYIKTSTGFNGKATIKDVTIMRDAIQGRAKIKAAGGVRNYEDAMNYINLGVSRLGTSSGLKIILEAKTK